MIPGSDVSASLDLTGSRTVASSLPRLFGVLAAYPVGLVLFPDMIAKLGYRPPDRRCDIDSCALDI